MISLNTEITVPAIREAAIRAWAWWTKELRASIPSSLREFIFPARPQLMVYLGSSEAIISKVDAGHEVRLSAFDVGAGTSEADIVKAVSAYQAGRLAEIHLLVSRALVLRRELELPKVAEARLRQIIELDLDRQTPFMPEDVAFEVTVKEQSQQAGRIRVALAVVKRSTIDIGLAICRRLGGRTVFAAIGDPGGLVSEFNLVPQSGQSVERERRSWKNPWYFFVAIIAGLVAVNIIFAFVRLDQRVGLLTRELEGARKDAQAAEKLQAQLEQLQAQQGLLAALQNQPQPLALIRELTSIIPDDTWLFQLQTEKNSVRISGFSPSASNLIEKLDKSAMIVNPKLRSTAGRPDKPGEERFEIGFEIREAGQK